MKLNNLVILASATGLVGFAAAGPLAWAGCQTACNVGYVVCCAAAGAVAGTFVLVVGAPAALVGCSVIQGTCMAACTPLLVAPSP